MGSVTADGRFVTHYHRADRRPFLNLGEVDDADVEAVLTGLVAGSRRRFGPRYLALRRATEARARELFVQAGGRPVRPHPHYFVLGESPWFAGLYDEPREVRVPLDRLPVEATSFTWVDSVTALGLGRDLGVPQPAEPERRRLHRIDELDLDVVDALPGHGPDGYEGYQRRLLEGYVEVQLWSDEPVARYLAR